MDRLLYITDLFNENFITDIHILFFYFKYIIKVTRIETEYIILDINFRRRDYGRLEFNTVFNV